MACPPLTSRPYAHLMTPLLPPRAHGAAADCAADSRREHPRQQNLAGGSSACRDITVDRAQDAKALCGLMEEASSAWRGAGALPPAPAELMASVDLTKARCGVLPFLFRAPMQSYWQRAKMPSQLT